jgi:aspartate kinase
MIVFKFGGASLKNSASIKNVASIISSYDERKLVVVSAIGKTTDALEKIVGLAHASKDFETELKELKAAHNSIMEELFDKNHFIFSEVEKLFGELETAAKSVGDFDEMYDQVVSIGEVLSSVILYEFLLRESTETSWQDARKIIATNSVYREAKVDWNKTAINMKAISVSANTIITQGFIGSTPAGKTTTLGREGSDFSAAIFASCLNAKSVTIWKDVPGVMNADPKKISSATIFEELPYKEAAEMTYYGASIIHPKTIKPLANKAIPLFVKSFTNPHLLGTLIHDCRVAQLPTLIVFKENQCLISCKVTDYSFINEEQLGFIFNTLSEHNVKINVMQNSAISLSFCVDFRASKILKLIEQLSVSFEVYYNTGLTLITIKNYDQKVYQEYRNRQGVILEQSSRSTLQLLVKAETLSA